MSNYTKTTNFAAKDSLPSGNAAKIVKGAEIDTEFNNIATASATKANANNAALTGTTVFATLSDGTIAITGWVDEDNMASNSAVLIPTQQSVKAYVDSNVTAQDLDVTDGTTSIDIDLDSESLGILGGTGVTSTASGTGVTLAIDSTVATLTGTQTLTNKTLTTPTILTSFTIGSATITEAELEILDGATVTTAELNHVDGVTSNIQTQINTKAPVAGATFTGTTTIPTADINGGAIDGTVIGGSTAAAGSFTTVAASSSLTIGGVTSVPFEAADHSKLDGIESGADVTDTANVVATLTAGSNITIASDGTIASTASGGDQTLQQTLSFGNTTTTDTKIQFRDTGLYINSSADGQLDIVADSEIQIAATTIDVNGILDVSGNVVVGGTVDGRDVATDGTKLDGIEASADVTDATNVTAAGALMDSEVTNLAQVKAFDSSDYATSAQVNAALPKTGGAMTGAITTNSTFDGRDVATDGTKLDGIESGADVTDSSNVTAAGALMDSELTSIGAIKAIDQNLTTSSYPTFNTVITNIEVRTPKIITNSTNANLDLDPNGSGKVVFKGNSSRGAGQFVLNCEQNSHGITIKGPPHSANASYTLTLPNNDGNADQLLETDGSGNLSWVDAPAASINGISTEVTNSDNYLALRTGNGGTYTYGKRVQINEAMEFTKVPFFSIGGVFNTMLGGGISIAPNITSTSRYNTFMGYFCANNVQQNCENVVAIGKDAFRYGTHYPATANSATGDDIAIGYRALMQSSAPTGNNVAIGMEAGKDITRGTRNIGIGYKAATGLNWGNDNVALGSQAGHALMGAYGNVAIGTSALLRVTESTWPPGDAAGNTYNVGIGYQAGNLLVSGKRNVIVGAINNTANTSDNDCIILGNNVTGTGSGNFTFGTGSSDSNIANGATSITAPSDARYKEEIKDATAGLSFIKDLRPVTFKWKKEKDIPTTQKAYVEGSETRVMNNKTNHGFIAQEVKAVIDSHSEIKNGFDMWQEDEADGRQRIGPSALIPILVKAIQELEERVNELENS